MKYVKIISLAAVAAMAFMAFAAGTASATKLYSTGVAVSKGTTINASLIGSASLENTAGEPLDTCTGGTVHGKTATTGGPNETVSGPISEITWTGCTDPTTTLKGGTLEIHHIPNTTKGTLTSSGAEVTINNSVIGSCIYGTGTATDLGILETGVLNIEAVVFEQEPKRFFCPDHAVWDAEYQVTTPHDLVVEAS
jgi:hypothetical protein